MTTHPDALPRARVTDFYTPLPLGAPKAEVSDTLLPEVAPDVPVEVEASTWVSRMMSVGKATADLVCHPFRWEFQYEYRPVKNSPEGFSQEYRATRVLRRKDPNRPRLM